MKEQFAVSSQTITVETPRKKFRVLYRELANPSEDPELRQQLLNQVTSNFHTDHLELFSSLTKCCHLAGLGNSKARLGELGDHLKEEGIPVGSVVHRYSVNGRIHVYHSYFVLSSDLKLAVKRVKKLNHRLSLDVNGNKEQYPYAHPVTFEFLNAAMTENAHFKVPMIHRIIGGIYYSTDATLEEIGVRAGFLAERERPRQIIKEFISHLWQNCSESLKRKFPLELIPVAKPVTAKSRERRGKSISLAEGGKRVLVLACIIGGLKLAEVEKLTNISLSNIKKIVKEEVDKQFGFVPSERARNRKLFQKLQNPPENFVFRQEFLDRAEPHFYKTHPELFARLSECFDLAGLSIARSIRLGNLDVALHTIEEANVPVRTFDFRYRIGRHRYRKRHSYIILRQELGRAVEALKNSREFRRSA